MTAELNFEFRTELCCHKMAAERLQSPVSVAILGALLQEEAVLLGQYNTSLHRRGRPVAGDGRDGLTHLKQSGWINSFEIQFSVCILHTPISKPLHSLNVLMRGQLFSGMCHNC